MMNEQQKEESHMDSKSSSEELATGGQSAPTPHTEGPWHVGELTLWNPGQQGTVRTANGEIVAFIEREMGFAVRDANAEFIVRACNSNHELVTALRLVRSHFKRSHDGGQWMGDDEHEAWRAVELALAHADGTQP